MPSLLLHAVDPQWCPADLDSFINTLLELGLIESAPAPSKPAEFPAGRQFLKLVMFLGCSPQVVLDPEAAQSGQTACFIRLLSYQRVTFLSGKASPAVRCPNCRTAVDMPSADTFEAIYQCEKCENEYQLAGLDWRQGAGFGRCFVEINGIYPQEAVPSDKLLNTLYAYSSCNWRYFYI